MDQPQMLFALAFMIIAAVLVIIVGSKRNLKKLKSSASGIEIMTSADAAFFPVAGSLALFTLYLAFKLVPRVILNGLLSVYLCMTAVFCLGGFIKPTVGANPVTGLLCVAVGVSYVMYKNWIVNNVLAIAIGVVAIENVQLGSFVTSGILLCGLFLYDIFWVFGTEVMVVVATNVDGPIKLLFPQTIFGDHTQKSLLGLGDIVIPGFFISQTYVFSKLASKGKDSFYFNVAMVAYFLSLINTMFVMVVFKHAQPALLYIVPWLLISTALAGVVKGEIAAMYKFDTDAVVLSLHGAADVAAAKAEAEQPQLVWSIVAELFGLDKKKDAAKNASGSGKKKTEKKANGNNAEVIEDKQKNQKENKAEETSKPVSKSASPSGSAKKQQQPLSSSSTGGSAQKNKKKA